MDWIVLDMFLVTRRTVYPWDARFVQRFVEQDGLRTVTHVLTAFHSWVPYSHRPAIFTLAMCVVHGDVHTRRAAGAAVNQVCCSLEGLYLFNHLVAARRGRGRIVNRAIRRWFNSRPTHELARQLLHFREGYGWRARDLLRLAHPVPPTAEHALIYQWVCQGWDERLCKEIPETPGTELILAHERARRKYGTRGT